jgi:FixJ family two-component response regulator
MNEPQATVYVVDDDPSVRAAVKRLIESTGLTVQAFATAREFLDSKRPDAPGCLILDVCLPRVNGLDLQRELTAEGLHLPVIFLTGHGDIPMTVQALKAGAVEFLTKPFRNQDLLQAVGQAVEQDCRARQQRAQLAQLRERHDRLTAREHDVLELVVSGRLNKQIASELGTSEVTVKRHRSQMMQKMEAESVADLVRMTDRLGIRPSPGVRSEPPANRALAATAGMSCSSLDMGTLEHAGDHHELSSGARAARVASGKTENARAAAETENA